MSSLENRRPWHTTDQGDDGFAMIIVIVLLTLGLLFGAAALAETLHSQSQGNRDQRYNRALQAADAGANATLYQLNELNLSTLDFNGGLSGVANIFDCLLPTGSGLTISGSTPAKASVSTGVCPPLNNPTPPVGEPANAVPVGDHAYYATAAIPTVTSDEGASSASTSGHTQLGYKVVSYGWDDGGHQSDTSHYQIRKTLETVAPLDPFETVEATGKITTNGVVSLNGNMRANGDLNENAATVAGLSLIGISLGSVTVSGIDGLNLLGPSGSPIINTATVEYGKTLTRQPTNLSVVPTPTQALSSFARPAITIAASAPDCNPAANCAALPAAYYNPATHMFTDSAGTAAVTLPGGDYIFCGFDVEKANVVATTTSSLPVRIFIDSPNSTRCAPASASPGVGNFTAKLGVSNILGTSATTAISSLNSQVTSLLGGSGNGLVSVVTNLLSGVVGAVQSLVSGLAPVSLTGANITALTATSQLQIYDVGSTSDSAGASSPQTSVMIGAGTTPPTSQAMFVYAPVSNVTMETNVFSGNIIGDNVALVPANGAAMVILQDLGLANSSLANSLGALHVSSYAECSSPAWADVLTTLGASPTTANLLGGC